MLTQQPSGDRQTDTAEADRQSPSDRPPVALLLKSQPSFSTNPFAARRPPVSNDTPSSAAVEHRTSCEEQLGAPLPVRAGRDSLRGAQPGTNLSMLTPAPASSFALAFSFGQKEGCLLIKAQGPSVRSGPEASVWMLSTIQKRGLEPRPRLSFAIPQVSVTLPAHQE